MIDDILKRVGLDEAEIMVYSFLLLEGESAAGEIIKNTPLKRGHVYNILKSLVEKGLVEMFEKNKVAHFRLEHPSQLEKFLTHKTEELKRTQAVFEDILPKFISQFQLSTKRPSVQYFEGIEGLQKIYDDIIREQSDICLIRSIYDDKHPEIDKAVIKQIQRQMKVGIHTRAITPLVKETPHTVLKHDTERFVTRRIISFNKMALPGQIIIYKNKAAITDLKDTFISTLIENKNIADTFRALFNYIWDLATPEHEKIVKKF
jgi:sugar-specific transcriptional regulator TrmB